MDETRIRQIIKEEIAASKQQDQYSVNRVPVHSHNGIDSQNIQPSAVLGMLPLNGTGDGVLALAADQTVSGPPADNGILNPPKIVVYPIPIIYDGGPGAAFNGGDAPNGTVLFFDNGSETLSALWIRTLNGWYGITPDTLI